MCCNSLRCFRINCHCICTRCTRCEQCSPGANGPGVAVVLGARVLDSLVNDIRGSRNKSRNTQQKHIAKSRDQVNHHPVNPMSQVLTIPPVPSITLHQPSLLPCISDRGAMQSARMPPIPVIHNFYLAGADNSSTPQTPPANNDIVRSFYDEETSSSFPRTLHLNNASTRLPAFADIQVPDPGTSMYAVPGRHRKRQNLFRVVGDSCVLQ